MNQQPLIKLTEEQRRNRIEAYIKNDFEIKYLKAELKIHSKEVHDRIKELETENVGIAADLGGLEGVEE